MQQIWTLNRENKELFGQKMTSLSEEEKAIRLFALLTGMGGSNEDRVGDVKNQWWRSSSQNSCRGMED